MCRVSPALALALVMGACAVQPRNDAGSPDGSAATPPSAAPDPRLYSLLWIQTSAEYANTTRQVFGMARHRLAEALEQPTISAVPDVPVTADLPPAVIVDVDDTILDNSPHAARDILAGRRFESSSWRRWVAEAAAPPLPGVLAYLHYADEAGVRLFYVTNRHHETEAATRRNLAALGCPMDAEEDVLLMRLERPDWQRDKVTRRRWVAERYRVVQILGDDLADFVSVPSAATIEQRRNLARDHVDRWGETWFQLPNPIYGGWIKAITPGGRAIYDSSPDDLLQLLETQ